MNHKIFSSAKPWQLDVGLLIFRVLVGLMMLPHGWPKLIHFAERAQRFSDPLGIGKPLSLSGTVLAEFFCSLFLIAGLFTRAALIPLIFTFMVICFLVHGADPISEKETPLLFLISYVVLFFTGPGKYSVDGFRK